MVCSVLGYSLLLTNLAPTALAQEDRYYTFSTVRELAQIAVKRKQFPAIGIVVMRNGKVLGESYIGTRSATGSDQVTANDRWLVGSITKAMTATMIAKLISNGKLQWNQKLSDGLPNVPMKVEYRNATLHQLLSHVSGVQADTGIGLNSTITPAEMVKITSKASTPTIARSEYAKHLLSRQPVGKPGLQFEYSNGGYAVAGSIAEHKTKMSFETLMQDLVFGHIGMKSARFCSPGETGMPGAAKQPMGHTLAANGNGKSPFSPYLFQFKPAYMVFGPAGIGTAMTVMDLARFGQYQLDGLNGKNRYLTQSEFRRLHTPYAAGAKNYGCGWVFVDRLGETASFHNGSDGSFYSYLIVLPKSRVVVAAIANCGPPTDEESALETAAWSGVKWARSRIDK